MQTSPRGVSDARALICQDICADAQNTQPRGPRVDDITQGLLVTLDSVRYASKPRGVEVGAITRRMQGSGPSCVTPGELCDAIEQGRTWCGGCFEPSPKGWGAFVSLQAFALDFDNAIEERGADGRKHKRDLREGESGYLHPMDAAFRCESLGLEYAAIYPTFSCDATADPPRLKYRIVFVLDEPIKDADRARKVINGALKRFPEADQACRNLNRLFYGVRSGEKCARAYDLWGRWSHGS